MWYLHGSMILSRNNYTSVEVRYCQGIVIPAWKCDIVVECNIKTYLTRNVT